MWLVSNLQFRTHEALWPESGCAAPTDGHAALAKSPLWKELCRALGCPQAPAMRLHTEDMPLSRPSLSSPGSGPPELRKPRPLLTAHKTCVYCLPVFIFPWPPLWGDHRRLWGHRFSGSDMDPCEMVGARWARNNHVASVFSAVPLPVLFEPLLSQAQPPHTQTCTHARTRVCSYLTISVTSCDGACEVGWLFLFY